MLATGRKMTSSTKRLHHLPKDDINYHHTPHSMLRSSFQAPHLASQSLLGLLQLGVGSLQLFFLFAELLHVALCLLLEVFQLLEQDGITLTLALKISDLQETKCVIIQSITHP